eukprot:1622795-Rhodomonas_salina.1
MEGAHVFTLIPASTTCFTTQPLIARGGDGGRAGRMYVEVDGGREREWDREGGESVHVKDTHT